MRKQYHLRDSERGLLAWDVHRLISLTAGLLVIEIPLDGIGELDQCFWFDLEGDRPTCRKIAEHAKLIQEVSLDHPIIVDPDGRVMDGMHRVCKVLSEGRGTIRAFRLPTLPEPDFVGVAVDLLRYDPE